MQRTGDRELIIAAMGRAENTDDRLIGVLVGTAVGDAVGLPAEGLTPARIARRWALGAEWARASGELG